MVNLVWYESLHVGNGGRTGPDDLGRLAKFGDDVLFHLHVEFIAVGQGFQGNLVENRGTWRDYLRKIPDVARVEIVSESHPDARVAVLHYTVVTRKGSRCLLQIQLETGRMHQIRVQSASRGLPILGDETYGSNDLFGPSADEPRGRWIALHASELGFQHPRSRENLRHIATLPACWPAGDDV